MPLAEKIQELRTSHNMSQECLAELLGVSRQAVSKWETGQSKPGTDHLIHLAELFQISPKDLASPDMAVSLLPDVKEEVNRMRGQAAKFKWFITGCLLLFLAAFSAALYTRFQGFSDITVFLCAAASAVFILSAFLPVLITILAFICRDCKKRGIRPAFYVFISLSAAGLLYYFLNRDRLAVKKD